MKQPAGMISVFIALAVLLAARGMADTSEAKAGSATTGAGTLLSRANLTAWCVVPFDARKRGPEERAAMLQRLGFKQFAYDWRGADIPSFDAEVEALKRHGVALTAWWFPTDANDPTARTILEVCKRHDIHPQLWVTGGGSMVRSPEEQAQRVEQEAERISKIVALAKPYGCAVELYTHNNWFGQTDNEIAVIERLKQQGIDGVGMVYNFSHGHWDIDDFPAKWQRMKPYVVAVNVSGMVKSEQLIPPAQGDYELEMLRVIQQSGWVGPIGLIAEQGGDAEVTLGNGLTGLKWLSKELAHPGSGGARPKIRSAELPGTSGALNQVRLVPGQFGKALDAAAGGVLLPGRAEWRIAPITVEVWAKLNSSTNYNVVVASDTKASGEHWELYSNAGAGDFSIFLPGKGGEVRSGVNICDRMWHHLAMVLEKQRVRLFVDGRLVKEQEIVPAASPVVPGNLAIGRTVESGIGCDGLIDDLRISTRRPEGIAIPTKALERDEATIALWNLDSLAFMKQSAL